MIAVIIVQPLKPAHAGIGKKNPGIMQKGGISKSFSHGRLV